MTVKIHLPCHSDVINTGEKCYDILTLFILMDYPIYVDTITLYGSLSILYFKGLPVLMYFCP